MLRSAALLFAALLLAACQTDGPGGGSSVASDGELKGELVVFAAASLAEAFDSLGESFVREHPHVEPRFSFAGSQTLAAQLAEGAPADVYASASAAQMDRVAAASRISAAQIFASNRLEIAVEPGNPHDIRQLEELAGADLVVVLGAPTVPIGAYTAELLARNGLELDPASREVDVGGILSKVRLGEADAGVVYRSDVHRAGGEVDGVEIAAADNVLATYPVAPLSDAPNPDVAAAFVRFVLSDQGAEILENAGFGPPP